MRIADDFEMKIRLIAEEASKIADLHDPIGLTKLGTTPTWNQIKFLLKDIHPSVVRMIAWCLSLGAFESDFQLCQMSRRTKYFRSTMRYFDVFTDVREMLFKMSWTDREKLRKSVQDLEPEFHDFQRKASP